MLEQNVPITQYSTIPVSGKYNDRQRSIQCRSKSKNEATKMLTPGQLWKQYHIEVGKLMTSELGLGLLDKMFRMKTRMASLQKILHARNHTHIGLDTHDYGCLRNQWSQHGFTVEPEFTFQLKVSDPS
jgi:Xaa-Pro aminopeptidase